MGCTITAAWNETTSTGSLGLNCGGTSTGLCHLAGTDGELVLTLHSDETHLTHVEEVIGGHLARFGSKETMQVTWVRADGAPGTTQGPFGAEDMERMRSEREARAGSSH